MTSPAAILVGAAMIAAAVLAAPHVAPGGGFQWVTQDSTLWRIDIVTGEVRSCEIQDADDRRPRPPGSCVAVRHNDWLNDPPRPRKPANGG